MWEASIYLLSLTRPLEYKDEGGGEAVSVIGLSLREEERNNYTFLLIMMLGGGGEQNPQSKYFFQRYCLFMQKISLCADRVVLAEGCMGLHRS